MVFLLERAASRDVALFVYGKPTAAFCRIGKER